MIEVKVIVECKECKCCLITKGDSHHCYICHVNLGLEELCGCGDCADKLDTWSQDGWRPWLNQFSQSTQG